MEERVGRKPDQKFVVICYGVAVVLSTLLSVIVSFAVRPEQGNLYIYLSYVLPQASYIGVFSYLYFGRNKNKFRDLLQKENVRIADYFLAIAAAAGLIFFAVLPNMYVRKLFELIGLQATVIVPELNTWYDFLLCAIILCVLPAIGEELVFRKSFCDGMEEVADYKTVLLCGLAFSLSHFNPAQTIHQFFLGCILALVYVMTKNITLTMTMHMVNNAIAVFFERIAGADIWNNILVSVIACVVGGAVLVAAMLLFHGKKRTLDNKKTGAIEQITVWMFLAVALIWAVVTGMSFIK